MTRSILVAALVLAACGSDGSDAVEAPSCQQALESFYGAGCSFSDENGQLSVNEMIVVCREILAEDAPGCRDDMDDLLFCLDAVGPASESCTVCSQEQEGLLTCS